MPDIEDGLKTAIIGSILGFVMSVVVSAILSTAIPGTGSSLAIIFNLLSIIIGIESLQKANYWGLTYSLGYFAGIAFIGKYFMESGEYPVYLLIIGFYIALKISRKM
jgi:hypothetical protein